MSLATTPSLPATALAASASIGGNGGKQCSRPRRIYIDMGVNWCNTLQLFRDLPEAWLPQGSAPTTRWPKAPRRLGRSMALKPRH